MQRETYWDYRGRRMREERQELLSSLYAGGIEDVLFSSSFKTELIKRIEELERKVESLSGNPKQLEMDL